MKTAHVASAFDGEGARLHGGRWNSPGTPLVYMAETISLAALEILVHLQDSQLLERYSLVRAEFGDRLVEELAPKLLPANWRTHPAPIELQELGDQWVASGRSLILRVPSAVVPAEGIYLINPSHPDLRHIAVGSAETFEFDPRLS